MNVEITLCGSMNFTDFLDISRYPVKTSGDCSGTDLSENRVYSLFKRKRCESVILI